MISQEETQTIKEKFDEVFGVKYGELVNAIFFSKDFKSEKIISWEFIFSKLRKQSENGSQSLSPNMNEE